MRSSGPKIFECFESWMWCSSSSSLGFTFNQRAHIVGVSFTLTPTMCARWLKVKPREEDEEHHIHDSKHSKIFGPLDRIYTRMLEWSMAHRGLVAVVAVLVLFSSVPIFRVVNVN